MSCWKQKDNLQTTEHNAYTLYPKKTSELRQVVVSTSMDWFW